jgi:ATP-dependent DNA helicase RecQ
MDLVARLRTHFAHEQFRPGQERIVGAVLGGDDVLAVMPTGSGKSSVTSCPPSSCQVRRSSSRR